jgi:hypothetical protein
MGRKRMSMADFIRKNPNMSAQEIFLKRGGNIRSISAMMCKVRKENGAPPRKRGRPRKVKEVVSAGTTELRNMRIAMAINHLKKALEYLHVNARVEG